MYMTFRNGVNPSPPGFDINGERYWLVKIRHKSASRTKWVNVHEDEPTVRAFIKNYGYGKRGKAKLLKN